MNFSTEQELIDAVVARLGSNGVEVFQGVPCLSRCIDLVYIEPDAVIAIEFKLHDWKRALQQARDHVVAVDWAYVCMPQRKVSEEMARLFAEAGVGLLFFSGEESRPFKEVIPALTSDVKWNTAENWLSHTLETRRRQNSEVH